MTDNMTNYLFFILLLLFVDCNCDGVEKPLVETPLGPVRGYYKTSFNGRKFSAFEGIPFAKSPIGQRRFEAPEPIEPWYGIWEANYQSVCAQTDVFRTNETIGDEDCLHVNVYAPRENKNFGEPLDVIVHIHGGAYMYGSGQMYVRPDYIMDRDVVFVTFNYRVGLLGFLSTEDEVVPGNNGMKDQVMALKWVQENIASFGGNPDSVTITGLSAGGASVQLHYLSEMSKGLFHRGFSQSGVALNSYSIQKGALKKTRIVAEAVGCPSSSSKELVDCLKQRPSGVLLDKVRRFFGFKYLPLGPFSPVVEKGAEPFLKADPYYLLTKGEVLDLPWIASIGKDEGFFQISTTPEELNEIDDNWESLAPVLLDFEYTLDKSLWGKTSEKIRKFYLGENRIDSDNADKLRQMIGDRVFSVDAENSIRLQAVATNSPVYFYIFSYLGDNKETKRVIHGGDFIYYWHVENRTENELKMKDLVLDMLISFAKTGTPVIEGIEWKPTGGDQLITYLNISSFIPAELTLETVEELTPRKFWGSLGFEENENLLPAKDEL